MATRWLCCHKNSALQYLPSPLQEVRPIATLLWKVGYRFKILPWWHYVTLELIGVATDWCSCNHIEQCCHCLTWLPQCCWVIIFLTTIAKGRLCIATKFLRRCNSLFLLPPFLFVVIFITTIAIGRLCIATKFLRRCNSLLLLPHFYFVVIFIMTIAIGSCLLQLNI
jgi:hypothetical protein